MVAYTKPLSKMHQRLNDKADERKALGGQNNTFWSDAHELHDKSLEAIEETHGRLASLLTHTLGDPERLARITDPQTLTSNVMLLTRDVQEHVERINAIFAKHVERTGSTTGPDDVMEVISINGEYADALEVYQTVIMPTVMHIFEQIGAIEELIEAEEAAKRDQALQAQCDVNVITDVQIKNESPAHV